MTVNTVPESIARLSRVFDVVFYATDTFGPRGNRWAIIRIEHRYGLGEHFDVVYVSDSGIATRRDSADTLSDAIAGVHRHAALWNMTATLTDNR
jgi:hypothetical protein